MLRVSIIVESGEVIDETFVADGEMVMRKELFSGDYPEGYHMVEAFKGWIEKVFKVME